MFRIVKRSLTVPALAAGLVALAACGNDNGMTGASGSNVTITISGMNGNNSFSPNPGRVAAGGTVSWHNADSVAHTATGAGFDTGTISPGATSAPMTFSTAGSFDYHCSIHPSMVGTLTVSGSGGGGGGGY